ncbi:MAG: class II aldolase/adducin family protein [Chloroflexi bacterium]|nr:MAG: class II aldolase/adducin family protein [Chloroflexota bacterium]
MKWEKERKAVLETACKMLELGLTVGSSGNVSLRLGGEELLAITPSGHYYDELSPEDIIVTDFEGEVIEGEGAPSIELMMHVAIYKARPDVRAIVHFHSPFASVVAVMGDEIPPILEDQKVFLRGEVKVVPHLPPGSKELAEEVVKALGMQNAVILQNHGAVCVGPGLKEALNACLYLEKTAMAFVFATLAGRARLSHPGERRWT